VQRLPGYPRWFPGLLLLTLCGLLGSGLWLIPSLLEMRLDMAIDWHGIGAERLLAAAIHALTAFLSLVLAGALAAIHLRIGWRRRLNHLSGTGLLVLFAAAGLSALGVYYAGDESLSLGSSIVHTVAGLASALLCLWHALAGRRLRRAAGSHPRLRSTP